MIDYETIKRVTDGMKNTFPQDVPDVFISSEQYRDLVFSNSLWSRIRRKYFGLIEAEVECLIIIHGKPEED